MNLLTASTAKLGTQHVVYNILSRFPNEVDCDYLTRAPNQLVPDGCEKLSLLSDSLSTAFERAEALNIGYNIMYFWARAYWLLSRIGGQYDVIWLHNPRLLPLTPRGLADNLIITYHNHLRHRKAMFHDFPADLYYQIFTQVEKRGIRRLDGVEFTVVYEEIADQLQDFGINSDAITYIGNGVDLARFTPKRNPSALREQLDLPDHHDIMLSLGSLTEQKRPLVLLQVFRQIAETKDDVTLLLAGDGPLRRDVERFVNRRGLNQVRYLGFVEEDEKPDLYALADYFILPSEYEGEPLALYEALSSGLPCIVSDIPNLRFVVDNDCGVVVDFESTDQAATDILAYISQERTDHARNARSYAKNALGWESKANAYLTKLEEIQ